MDDVLVIGGGIMPEEDIAALEAQGVHKLFGPGTPTRAHRLRARALRGRQSGRGSGS
jgi:methylmalonyl-CoA mutase cobalamin-binding domain/chain